MFDGLCFDDQGNMIALDLKTNKWGNKERIEKFLKDRQYSFRVLSFNVNNQKKECKGHYKVFVRTFD